VPDTFPILEEFEEKNRVESLNYWTKYEGDY